MRLLILLVFCLMASVCRAVTVEEAIEAADDRLGESYDAIWQKEVAELCPFTKVVMRQRGGDGVWLVDCLEYRKDCRECADGGPAIITWQIGKNPAGHPYKMSRIYHSPIMYDLFTENGQILITPNGPKLFTSRKALREAQGRE